MEISHNMKRSIPLWQMVVVMCLAGCSAFERIVSPPASLAGTPGAEHIQSAFASLDLLSLVGAISILGGIIALVITSGRMGGRACLLGLGAIIINFAVARYAHWFFAPILLATAAVSLTYGYRIVRRALAHKKENGI